MDAPVGESSPHIANIGRMVEVSVKFPFLIIVLSSSTIISNAV